MDDGSGTAHSSEPHGRPATRFLGPRADVGLTDELRHPFGQGQACYRGARMTPPNLQAESFAAYPPQARALAIEHLSVFKRMPLILLAALLRQVIQYDWSFPAEREQLVRQLNLLNQLDTASFTSLMSPFAAIPLTTELSKFDWVNHPQPFSEKLTAYLWEQHLSDNYHSVAQAYQQYLEK